MMFSFPVPFVCIFLFLLLLLTFLSPSFFPSSSTLPLHPLTHTSSFSPLPTASYSYSISLPPSLPFSLPSYYNPPPSSSPIFLLLPTSSSSSIFFIFYKGNVLSSGKGRAMLHAVQWMSQGLLAVRSIQAKSNVSKKDRTYCNDFSFFFHSFF